MKMFSAAAWTLVGLERLWQDIRYGARMLAASPAFTIVAVLSPAMGIEPTIGRSFRPEEDRVPGRDAVVVLGATMWKEEFGSDRAIVGRIIRINGTPFAVIGVAPSAFTGMNPIVRADFFVPLMMSAQGLGGNRAASLEARDSRNLTLKGRLKSGVSQQQAQLELNSL